MSEPTPELPTEEQTPDDQTAREQSDGDDPGLGLDPDRNPVSDAAEPDIADSDLPEDLQPTDDNPLAQDADPETERLAKDADEAARQDSGEG